MTHTVTPAEAYGTADYYAGLLRRAVRNPEHTEAAVLGIVQLIAADHLLDADEKINRIKNLTVGMEIFSAEQDQLRRTAIAALTPDADVADGPCTDPACPNASWPHLASADLDADPTGLTYSRADEADDPTPVSGARVPAHHEDARTGEVVFLTAAGLTPDADASRGPLAGTTPVVVYCSFGYGQKDPDTFKPLLNHYVTVVGPTYDRCREAMNASRFGQRWSTDYLAGRAKTTEAVRGWIEHEVIVAPGVDQADADRALAAAMRVLDGGAPVDETEGEAGR